MSFCQIPHITAHTPKQHFVCKWPSPGAVTGQHKLTSSSIFYQANLHFLTYLILYKKKAFCNIKVPECKISPPEVSRLQTVVKFCFFASCNSSTYLATVATVGQTHFNQSRDSLRDLKHHIMAVVKTL